MLITVKVFAFHAIVAPALAVGVTRDDVTSCFIGIADGRFIVEATGAGHGLA